MDRKLRIAIRADASLMVGTGHIMRCFVIAARLIRKFDAEVMFIMREHQGHLIEFIEQKKAFALAILPAGEPSQDVRTPYNLWLGESEQQDIRQTCLALKQFKPDWVLFDHYALGEKSHRAVKAEFDCAVAVIDDLADRPLACDLLIDHNCARDPARRYTGLLPEQTKCFLGPRYTPFRDELLITAGQLGTLEKDSVKRVFVFLGGGDTFAATERVLKALISLPRFSEIQVDAVVGMSCPNREQLESLCANHPNVNYYCQTPRLGELMAAATLAVGAGGINSSERVLLRLPAVTLSLAANQTPGLVCYDQMGCVRYLGECDAVSQAQLSAAINRVLFDDAELEQMRQACAALIPMPTAQDGLSEVCHYLRDAIHENR